MILNIFGPSGSGKTTFVRKLLKHKKAPIFFEDFSALKFKDYQSDIVSISLIPLPKFRGTVKELFNIFSIDINRLLTLDYELKKLSESIFQQINDKKTLERISSRQIETFSAGETRRLFLLKTLLVDSNLIIVDEPFSNSDKKLWEIIYKAINKKKSTLVLSHLSLENLFGLDENNISIHISEVLDRFVLD